MNIGCLGEYLFDEDFVALIAYWRMEDKFCENIKALTLDSGEHFIVFEGCTMKSLLFIFLQCPYLVLADNETREKFMHSGEDLDIQFLLFLNWTYEV